MLINVYNYVEVAYVIPEKFETPKLLSVRRLHF